MEVQFKNSLPSNQSVQEDLQDLNLKSLILQPSENNTLTLRYALEEDKINQEVMGKLKEKYPDVTQLKLDYTNATVS